MGRRIYKVGDVVYLKTPCLGNKIGAPGVVIQQYDIGYGPSVQIIFKNGEYDGFSPEEQSDFLAAVGHCTVLENYTFNNVIQLTRDFQRGVFKPMLNPVHISNFTY